MADVKWIKLDVGIFEDEKIKIIASMPEGKTILIIWLKLLCLAGRINNAGVMMVNGTIPYTVEMLASVFSETEKIMRVAIDAFERLGMIEMFNGAILLPNWEKHQSIAALEKIRTSTRARVEKHRNNQRKLTSGDSEECTDVTLQTRYSNGDVTQQNKNKNKNKNKKDTPPTPRGGDGRFDQFWEAYPRKTAKENARKAFAKHKFDDDTLHTVLEALNTQKTSDQWQKEGGQFIPYAATWLNQRRWEDDLPTPAGEVNWAVPS